MFLFDLDGVICNCVPAILEVMSKKVGRKLSYSKLHEYDFESIEGITKEIILDTLDYVFARPKLMRPFPGAISTLEALAYQAGPVTIISHRFGKYGVRGAKAWLDLYIPSIYKLIIASPEEKVEIMLSNPDYKIVEDNPYTLLELAKFGKQGIMFSAPYNMGVSNENIIRVNNWKELQHYILQ